MKSIRDAELSGRRVLLRLDLNVPMNGRQITDVTRIKAVLPTIKYLVGKHAKVIIISHLGRPGGKVDYRYSLEVVAKEMEKLLKQEVRYLDSTVGDLSHGVINHLMPGEILMLENLRFHLGEEANDDKFAQQLAELGDIYVNDAFACSHRNHASVVAITRYLPSYVGLLMEHEVKSLSDILSEKAVPRMAIIAGKKVSTKIEVLMHLAEKMDFMFVGGAMANTLLKAQGHDIGASYYEKDFVEKAQKFLSRQSSCQIMLPKDVVVAKPGGDACRVLNVGELGENDIIYDVGPETMIVLAGAMETCASVVWNGPLGMFEDPRFAVATSYLAQLIAKRTQARNVISVVGGGDTLAAIEKNSLMQEFTFASTAGGAFLEWLEGKGLPGIRALLNAAERLK
jgi:phosphoglycerate kinase